MFYPQQSIKTKYQVAGLGIMYMAKLVRFNPTAIARNERTGHNWNVGIMEYWGNGLLIKSILIRELKIPSIIKFL